jgi:hypothetical protein
MIQLERQNLQVVQNLMIQLQDQNGTGAYKINGTRSYKI